MAKRKNKSGAFDTVLNPANLLEEYFLMALEDQLGTAEDVIAANLEDLGIKGERGDATSCPLANYLNAEGFYVVRVDKKEIELGTEMGSFSFKTPKYLAAFIKSFDKGEYPELEAAEDRSDWR